MVLGDRREDTGAQDIRAFKELLWKQAQRFGYKRYALTHTTSSMLSPEVCQLNLFTDFCARLPQPSDECIAPCVEVVLHIFQLGRARSVFLQNKVVWENRAVSMAGSSGPIYARSSMVESWHRF